MKNVEQLKLGDRVRWSYTCPEYGFKTTGIGLVIRKECHHPVMYEVEVLAAYGDVEEGDRDFIWATDIVEVL